MKDQLSEWLSTAEACELVNVKPQTLRRWDREGKLHCIRTGGNQRRYNRDELLTIMGLKRVRNANKYTIGYCRVSSTEQKNDLARQEAVVSNFCEQNGYVFRIIKDVASGLNYKRPGLIELMEAVASGKVERVVVNYRDRLARFGVELMEQVFDLYGVELVIINQTSDITDEQELVQDVLSIITVFSARLYGKRSHKNQKIVEESKRLFTEDSSNEEADKNEAFHKIEEKA